MTRSKNFTWDERDSWSDVEPFDGCGQCRCSLHTKKGRKIKEVGCGCKPASYIQQIDPEQFSPLMFSTKGALRRPMAKDDHSSIHCKLQFATLSNAQNGTKWLYKNKEDLQWTKMNQDEVRRTKTEINKYRNTEILANSNREVEGLTLAGQWTALGRIPSKREQSSVTFGHCSHFDSAFKLGKCSNVK